MAKKKGKALKVKTKNALRKKYYGSGSARDIVLSGEEMLWLPSSFLALNDLLGGGVPYGKILEIYGEESSGKSLIAFDFAHSAQALGGVVLWADAEFAFTHDWAIANGIDLDGVELYQEKAIELIADWSLDMALAYRAELTNNEPILLVLDSIAALDCLVNMNSSQVDAKAEMGNRAKAMDRMLRIRNGAWDKLGVSVILINQVRSKIGAGLFEDPETTPGGKATKFYASQRIGVYGGKQLKGKVNGQEDRVGRVSTIRVKKNKVAPPKPTIRQAEVYFHPEYKEEIGFSRYFDLPKVLERSGVLTRKKGSSLYYYNEEMVARGEPSLLKKLKTDDKFRAKMIRKSKVNTISRTRRKMQDSTNLFPISKITKEDMKSAEDEE